MVSWWCLGFSIYEIIYIISRQNDFTSLSLFFFFYWISFIILLALFLRLQLPIMCLMDSEGRLPCFVPDLRGKAFHFLPLSMLVTDLPYMVFIRLRYSPSTSILLTMFTTKRCCILLNVFLPLLR